MFKSTAIALTLLSLSLTASADWQVGGGFSYFSESSGDDDLLLNIVYGSVAYKIKNPEKNYFFIPELRIGTGVNDDSYTNTRTIQYGSGYGTNYTEYSKTTTFEVERFIALSIRGQYEFRSGAYVYAMPSYANVKGKVSSYGGSDSDDNWEFGVGAGVGYNLNKKVSVEASYENYDDVNLLSAGFKYAF
jgi:opacity protein-like surface antigen